MLKRTLLYLAPLATSLGPVAYYAAPEWTAPGGDSAVSEAAAFDPTAAASAWPPATTMLPGATLPGTMLPGTAITPFYPLEEVLRFDITPGWLIQRWPRVSSGLGQLQLHGYRVPLVTGTAEYDVAGALTYYFNSSQQVERITLQGTTGDARHLVQVLTTRFGFARRLTNTPGVFAYEVVGSNRKVRSSLQIRPAGTIEAASLFDRFQFALSLERPEAP